MNTSLVLTSPKTQLCAVLEALIKRHGISERQMPFNSFRTRLSDLRIKHGLSIQVRHIEFTNQFGHDGFYNEHYLLDEDKEQAVELYKRLNG